MCILYNVTQSGATHFLSSKYLFVIRNDFTRIDRSSGIISLTCSTRARHPWPVARIRLIACAGTHTHTGVSMDILFQFIGKLLLTDGFHFHRIHPSALYPHAHIRIHVSHANRNLNFHEA